MTAVNIFLNENAVHMMTDGAAYDEDCRLQRRTQKTYALPHLKMVIATRGKSYLAPLVAMVIEAHCETFDEVVAKISDLLKHHLPLLAAEIGYALGDDVFDLMAAGISDDGKPAAFGVTSAGGLAWQVQPVVDVLVSPSDEDFRRDVAMPIAMMARCQGRSELQFDPAIEGVQLMDAQRLYFSPTRIGAFMQLSTVEARDGSIKSDVVKFWPDKPGEVIGSTPRRLLSSENGAIENLSIKTLKLGDNAVTVPKVAVDNASYGGGAGAGSSGVEYGYCYLTMPIDTTGLTGKPIDVVVNSTINVSPSSGNITCRLLAVYAGVVHELRVRTFNQNGNWTLPLLGTFRFIAQGGAETVTFSFGCTWYQCSFDQMIITAIAAKR